MANWIFFDCMDTLVHLRDHGGDIAATHARRMRTACRDVLGPDAVGADFDARYAAARTRVRAARPPGAEYALTDVLRAYLEEALRIPTPDLQTAVATVAARYWASYVDASFVLEGTRACLGALARRHHLAVVSNFIVPGGIGELLKRHGLRGLFEVVVVSIEVGWRKPTELIYTAALKAAACRATDVLFVGDDVRNDYWAPRSLGMQSILFDPECRHPELERIGALGELLGLTRA